ncbi:hypothetical protein GIB67_030464 [Kingdonia uniflora]|uniref:Uncharacterized protein n=1 Tax=Kingdonia uniflora TaxID=39325 RepID=A0A7J7P733_9MAGN|nr:hypothetical protein GIB67_030464 [Kingdonia uniflora]
MYSFLPFFSVLVLIVSLIQSNATANSFIGSVGANIDYASRAGREEKIAMEMAVDNFYKSNGSKIMLKLVDSQGSATRAISSGNITLKFDVYTCYVSPYF